MNSYSLLVHHLGPARTLDMLLRARLLTAEQAHGAGFVAEVAEDGGLDEALTGVVETLLAHAPLSMKATGQAVARLRRATLPDGDDLVREVFGSEDFRAGVRAFVAREQVTWRGR
jgi:enoyl-CoA hydratase/carnithine racemase